MIAILYRRNTIQKCRNTFENTSEKNKQEEKHMSKGRFGVHGGQYIPETLMNAMLELEEAYKK